MSEYWVSHKKYFCRYCDIYIADDAPSKQQHENGMRHKGNKERFVRGLYKQGEKRKKDLDEEAREMARVEQAAQAAFAQDVNAGIAKLPSSTAPVASTSTAPRKPPPKPTNAFSNYSTAESLGYQDPDAERLAAEAERRRMEGVAGDWQLLPPVPSSSSSVSDSGLKREAETPIDEEDNRQFKLRKKTLGVGLGEIYDPGVIPIKLKKKDESPVVDAGSTSSQPTEIPKWTKVQWKRPGDGIKEEAISTTESSKTEDGVSQAPIVKPVDHERPVPESLISPKTERPVKLEVDVTPNQTSTEGGSMFRKRKTPAGGNRGKRQL